MRFAAWGLMLAAVPVLLGSTPAIAAARQADGLADSSAVSVVLSLTPSDRGALASAASRRSTPFDQTRSLRAAAPTSTSGDKAARFLSAHGFTVTQQSRWLVSATGTAKAARAAFGARLVRDKTHIRPTTPIAVPAALRGSVSAVTGLDTRPRWRSREVPQGLTAEGLKTAYDVAAPIGTGAGMTVASVQFSGWVRTDLETYADAAGLPRPSVVERPTGAASASVLDGNGGELEAALDHEALLATAPGATQQIFFGVNSEAGAVQMYDAVATAAEKDEFDVLSISWGQCEPDMPLAAMIAINDSLARVVAAGKTVFAASGDAGVFDCTSTAHESQFAVDFPASSPYVVAVGGTRLLETDGAMSEIGWSNGTAGVGGAVAGGGGFSTVFDRPTWQPASTPDDPAGTKRRMVPDIAAVADPRSGFGVYSSTHGGWVVAGGTSLAAPVAAGHFAAALGTGGRTTGLGQPLHPLLYSNPAAFRDIVEGGNFGFAARAGYDLVTGLGSPKWSSLLPIVVNGPVVNAPATTRARSVPVTITPPLGVSYTHFRVCENNEALACNTPDISGNPQARAYQVKLGAGPSRVARVVVIGYDATGPHPGIASTRFDVTPPTVTAAVRLASASSTRAQFSWGATDPDPGTGLAEYELKVTQHGVAKPLRQYRGPQTSWSATLRPGGQYTLAVRASDKVGNMTAWRTSTLSVALDQTQLAVTGKWTKAAHPTAYGGSVLSSSTTGSQATQAVRGSSVDALIMTGPTGGMFDVLINSKVVRRVDTYSAVRQQKTVRIASWPGPSPRVVTVRVVGARNKRSRGTTVVLDGLLANWT